MIEKILRRVRHQPRHPQPRPEAVARLLAAGEDPRSLPGTQPAHRRLPRPRATGCGRASTRSRQSEAGRPADHAPDPRPQRADEPKGTTFPGARGVGKTEQFVREIRRLGIRPTLFGLEYSYDWLDSMPEMGRVCRSSSTGCRSSWRSEFPRCSERSRVFKTYSPGSVITIVRWSNMLRWYMFAEP